MIIMKQKFRAFLKMMLQQELKSMVETMKQIFRLQQSSKSKKGTGQEERQVIEAERDDLFKHLANIRERHTAANLKQTPCLEGNCEKKFPNLRNVMKGKIPRSNLP